MPKIVDHEERRREIAAAVWRIIARDGIEGVSIRAAAAEAGWSTGALRHYLPTKEALLAFAARRLVDRVLGRLDARPRDGAPRELIRAALCAVLPLDEERRDEWRIWFAFARRSLAAPGASDIGDEGGIVFDGTRDLCAIIARDLAALGLLPPDHGPAREGERLHALIDGLALHAMLGRRDPDATLAILDDHLGAIIRDRSTAREPRGG